MKTNKFLLIIPILIIFFIINGCQKDNPVNIPNPFYAGDNIGDSVLKAYMDQFYWDDVFGIIGIEKTYQNTEFPGLNGTDIFEGWYDGSYAKFISDDKQNYITYGTVSINGIGLWEYAIGHYQIQGDQDYLLNNKFGNGYNIINIFNQDSLHPKLYDSVQFDAPLTVTNVSRGQNVSKSSNFTVNWTGGVGPNSIVQYKFMPWNTDSAWATNPAIVSAYLSNTGTVALSPQHLQNLRNGLFRFYVQRDNVIMLTLSNGKKVAVFGHSTYYTTINIVD